MKKAVILLAWLTMGICCLITLHATKDTVLKNVTSGVEEPQTAVTEEEIQTDTEAVPILEEEEIQTEGLLIDQNNRYAFGCLGPAEKQTYLEILSALLQQQPETVLTDADPEQVDKAFQCVMLDYPEIFYVDGYQYVVKDELIFYGEYLYDSEQIRERQVAIDAYTDTFLAGISKSAGEYEKVKAVYEQIIRDTEYDPEAVDNQNICSVFITHRSVCQGYAKATQYLLNQMGIEATLVTGTVKNAEGHAWNLIKIDGSYYYVDTTWGDACYQLSQEISMTGSMREPTINYDYLNVPTKQLLVTHTIDSIIPMPECEAMEANYYVVEGAYFTGYDEEQLAGLFKRAQKEQQETVTIKCADTKIYEDMLEELIQNQKVFQYLTGQKGTVAYTDSPYQRSISFWL